MRTLQTHTTRLERGGVGGALARPWRIPLVRSEHANAESAHGKTEGDRRRVGLAMGAQAEGRRQTWHGLSAADAPLETW